MNHPYIMRAIARVKNERMQIKDDHWGSVVSEIILNPDVPTDALAGIEGFSHLEIIFYFDRIEDEKIITGSAHPRGRKDLPKTGIFAQRKKSRPNRLGSTIVKLIDVDQNKLKVQGLDAINGTPVLDIKPVMSAFLPREPVVEPKWVSEVMKHYWN